jgi:hypothetical protein
MPSHFRPGNPHGAGTYSITMSNGALFMETEGKATGAVTHFTRTWVEEELNYTRKPGPL